MIGEVISGHMTADSDARAGALRSATTPERPAKVNKLEHPAIMEAGDRVANLLGHLNPAYVPEVPSLTITSAMHFVAYTLMTAAEKISSLKPSKISSNKVFPIQLRFLPTVTLLDLCRADSGLHPPLQALPRSPRLLSLVGLPIPLAFEQ